MRKQLAVFDMDGTILNTLEDLSVSLNFALTQCGYPVRTYEECRCFVGNGIRKLLERAAPAGTDSAAIDRLHAAFTAHYRIHCNDHTRPYPGITDALRTLRAAGWQTAVVSNKPDYGVQELCKQHFDGLFDAATGERAGMAKKPAPDLVDLVLRRLGLPRSAAVYIGDSEVDIATARNAGLDAVIVEWGFRDRAFLRAQGAEVMVQSTEALLQLLLG